MALFIGMYFTLSVAHITISFYPYGRGAGRYYATKEKTHHFDDLPDRGFIICDCIYLLVHFSKFADNFLYTLVKTGNEVLIIFFYDFGIVFTISYIYPTQEFVLHRDDFSQYLIIFLSIAICYNIAII